MNMMVNTNHGIQRYLFPLNLLYPSFMPGSVIAYYLAFFVALVDLPLSLSGSFFADPSLVTFLFSFPCSRPGSRRLPLSVGTGPVHPTAHSTACTLRLRTGLRTDVKRFARFEWSKPPSKGPQNLVFNVSLCGYLVEVGCGNMNG